ncbi:MAG: beta-ketoacyl-[acyl-carrier-protein] synthase family protein [Thermoleophilia bacterium]
MRRRVVVTGIGVVSSIGTGVEDVWSALLAGASGARAVEVEGVGSIPAFTVDAEDAARERFGQREVRRMDRAGRLAALAGALALEHAGDLACTPERMGGALGSAHGGAETLMDAHRTFLERGADRVSPFSVALSLPNSPVAAMTRMLGLRGPSSSCGTACAAGSDAIGIAMSAIRDGRADVMLAGGAEAPMSPVVVAGYLRAGALSRNPDPVTASRPFDVHRDGFVMGEGAGVLVLEERERAIARGAAILAELAGYGASCDAAHLTDPDPAGEGAARAIAAALADAGLTAADIGYVNAHATSTPAGDVAEAAALVRAGLGGVPVSATKSSHGHMLGAAGGIEAAVTVLAVARGVLPPTRALADPDPAIALDHILEPREARVTAAVSNSFGFGGHNATLVVTAH